MDEATPSRGLTLASGDVVGGYRVESVAGRGGMGVVYRATQIALDRVVAVKVLTPSLAADDAFRARFERESKLLAAMDHPNVVTVHEAGAHDGMLFIAMRFVPGTDLAEVIRRDGAIPPRRAAALIAQVAAALDAAHGRGLIHRDVKPANILIEDRGGEEHVYLSDFGLTKQVESSAAELTESGQWVGTVDYIAPEQVLGHPVDARADIYALGCVLYAALSGTVPYKRDSAIATLFAHVSDPVPSLRAAHPEIPEALDAVVARAMAKDPADRFPSAGDFGRAAVAAAAGRETAAPERVVARGAAAPADDAPAAPTVPGAGTHASRRRWPLVAAISTGLAAAVVAAVVLLAGGGSSDESSDGDAVHAKSLVTQSIPVTGRPTALAVGDEALWVARADAGSLRPLDASGVSAPVVRVGDGPSRVAVGDGFVFAATDAGIVRVDEKTRKVVGRPIEVSVGDGGRLAAGEGALFVTARNDGQLVKVDAKSGRVITRATAKDAGFDGPLAVGAGAVWAGVSDGKQVYIDRYDTASLTLQKRIPLGRGYADAGIAFGENAVWVADWNKNFVHRIDPAANRVVARVKISSGISSDDIAVGGGAVWLVSANDHQVVRIDPARNTVIGSPTPASTSQDTELAVGLHGAWISDPDNGAVIRLKY
jgi:DNA-binding beta-propeller fold protein YncE